MFKNCVLTESKVTAKGIDKLLGLTVTLDCNTFGDVELSEDMFDLLLLLLCKGKGNNEKRAKLLALVGEDRAYSLLKQMAYLENKRTK